MPHAFNPLFPHELPSDESCWIDHADRSTYFVPELTLEYPGKIYKIEPANEHDSLQPKSLQPSFINHSTRLAFGALDGFGFDQFDFGGDPQIVFHVFLQLLFQFLKHLHFVKIY